MPSSSTPPACAPLPCACATLKRASRAVTQLYDAALRPLGLRPTQFTLLQALERTQEIRQVDLADLLGLDSTTLTRTLKLLEDQAWIESVPGTDQRERLIKVTARGAEQLRGAEQRWLRAQTALRKAVGASEWTVLLAALDRASVAARKLSHENL